jgi:hypothetical protein
VRLAVAGIVLAALLAGCLGDSGGDGSGGSATTSTTTGPGAASSSSTTMPPAGAGPFVVDLLLDFAFEGCRGVSVVSSLAPIEDVQALLPDGFTAAASDVPGGNAASVAVDLLACANLTVAGQTRLQDTYYGQVYTFIERPAERVPDAPDAPIQEYVFRTLAGEDVLAALWPAAGYDTRSGPAHLDLTSPGVGLPVDPGLRMADGAAGDYALTANGNLLAPSSVSGGFARYTALADGSVLVWTGSHALDGAFRGQGSADVADDDALARFEAAGGLQGEAFLWADGALRGMDLRRVFTPLGP